jgi:hypothetical protein
MTSEWLYFRLITATVAATACFVFAGFLFLHGSDRRISRLFGLSNLFLGLWNISDLVTAMVPTHGLSLFFDRLSYVWATLLVFVFFRFAREEAGEKFVKPIVFKIHSFVAIFLSLLCFTPLVIKDVITRPNLVEIPGPLFLIFAIYFVFSLFASLYGIHSAWRRAEGLKRNQLKYIALGIWVGTIAGVLYLWTMYQPSIPPFYFVIELIYVSLVPITILRTRMMDINMAFRFSMVYLVLGFALGLPLAGLMWLLSGKPWVAAVSFVIPTLGYFLIQRCSAQVMGIVDRLPPFRGRYGSLRVLEHHEREVALGGSLGEWANRLVKAAREILCPESVSVLVRDTNDGTYLVMAGDGISSAKKAFLSVSADSPLLKRVKSGGILFKELIEKDPSDDSSSVQQEMDFLNATVVVPISYGEQIQALLCLGPKIGRDMYNDIDLAGLHGLAKSAELALNTLLSGAQGARNSAAWAHDLLHPLGPKGPFHTIDDFYSGKHGDIDQKGRDSLLVMKADLEFIRSNLKNVISNTPVSAMKIKTVRPRGMFDRLRERYKIQTEASGITWKVADVPESIEISADEPSIERRVFGNLVENALRHTPRGGTVEVGYRLDGKTFVGFVKDTGPGIKKEDIPRLFSPGTQLDPQNKGVAGLGLANVKSVVEFHNGRVWVDSQKGIGATFFFCVGECVGLDYPPNR